MIENISDNVLEAEIAELNREIENKRRELEEKKGMISERGALHEVIAEKLDQASADAASLRQELKSSTAANQNNNSQSGDYLNALSDDQVEIVNHLVSLIPEKGIKQAIAEAKKLNPFLLDAFHDALVDKLYEELTSRGLVDPNRTSN